MKTEYFLFFAFILLTSCKETDTDDPAPPPPDDTTAFVAPPLDDMVIYEVNIRALGPSADFQGVIGRLDEIKALGANVIWLMPIHPVGQVNSVNSPYCVRNYKEVNPEFGTLPDFKALVTEAHKRKIAVIIDWVANHTAWDNPWITHKEWYTQDGSGNIIHPPGTNWQDVADLNFSNAEMRLEMIASMQYWINGTGIDGFRCDAADYVPFDFWQQALQSLNAATEKELILLAEGARTDHFTAGFQMNYSWDFYSKLKQVFREGHAASTLLNINMQEYNTIPAGAQKLRFTTNHDESAWDATPVELFYGREGALAASVIAIYLSGVPLIYGSQEVGVSENVPFFSVSSINWSQNPDMLEAYRQILAFYNSTPVLKKEYDGAELLPYASRDVLGFLRVLGQEQVFVMVNTRNKEVSYDIPLEMEPIAWKDAFDGTSVTLTDSIQLHPYHYKVLKNF